MSALRCAHPRGRRLYPRCPNRIAHRQRKRASRTLRCTTGSVGHLNSKRPCRSHFTACSHFFSSLICIFSRQCVCRHGCTILFLLFLLFEYFISKHVPNKWGGEWERGTGKKHRCYSFPLFDSFCWCKNAEKIPAIENPKKLLNKKKMCMRVMLFSLLFFSKSVAFLLGGVVIL